MTHDTRRITLIGRHQRQTERKWNTSAAAPSRLILLESLTVLRYSVNAGLVDMDVDVERIILDRCGSATEFLGLLATLPHEFRGDVLFVRDDGGGFLNAPARGGDRVMYQLTPPDVDFYLQTHALVPAATAAGSDREKQRPVAAA